MTLNNNMTLLFQDNNEPLSSQIKNSWRQLKNQSNNKNNSFIKVDRLKDPRIFQNFGNFSLHLKNK